MAGQVRTASVAGLACDGKVAVLPVADRAWVRARRLGAHLPDGGCGASSAHKIT